jgi:hypothetical protein
MGFLPRFAGCALLAFAAGCSTQSAPPPMETPPLVTSDGSACGDACANMVNCSRQTAAAEAFADCGAKCNAADTAATPLINCLGASACLNVMDCFPVSTFEQCLLARNQRVEECGVDSYIGHGFECAGLNAEHVDCLSTAACADLEACTANSLRAKCAASCSKIAGCTENAAASINCLSQCLDGRDPEAFNTCVGSTACNAMDLCLVHPQICIHVCDRLMGCEISGFENRRECERRCGAPWSEEVTTCVRRSNCELMPACGEMP